MRGKLHPTVRHWATYCARFGPRRISTETSKSVNGHWATYMAPGGGQTPRSQGRRFLAGVAGLGCLLFPLLDPFPFSLLHFAMACWSRGGGQFSRACLFSPQFQQRLWSRGWPSGGFHSRSLSQGQLPRPSVVQWCLTWHFQSEIGRSRSGSL